MRVAVDARVLAKPDPAGVTRYTDSLLRALAARDDGVSYLVFGVELLSVGLRDGPTVKNAGIVPGTFFLLVGSLSPRKNVGRLFNSYERHREYTNVLRSLVLAGVQRDVTWNTTVAEAVDVYREVGGGTRMSVETHASGGRGRRPNG